LDDRHPANDDPRQRFFEDDRRYADAGLNLVRTLEVAAKQSTVRTRHAERSQRVDVAIRTAGDPRSRVRALETELVNLGLADPGASAPDGESFAETRMRLLAADDGSETLSPALQSQVITLGRTRPELSYASRRRLVLERANPSLPVTLEQARDHGAREL
jgi:hypothetical protein